MCEGGCDGKVIPEVNGRSDRPGTFLHRLQLDSRGTRSLLCRDHMADSTSGTRTTSQTCCICLGPSKYRCPKCPERYCSVKCCKEHKQIHVEAVASTNLDAKGADPANATSEEDSHVKTQAVSSSEDTKTLLSDKQKGRLTSSSYIKDMLKSERLRKHIESIDQSHDRGRALKKLRSNNKEFNEFVSKMVDLVGTAE